MLLYAAYMSSNPLLGYVEYQATEASPHTTYLETHNKMPTGNTFTEEEVKTLIAHNGYRWNTVYRNV